MARQRKTPQDAVAKWQRNVQQAAPYYQQGVQRAQNWAANAVAAAPRRNAGLQAAINNGTIDAGIQRAGDAKWKANTLSKGVQNWAPATAAAAPQYGAGMQRAFGYFSSADQAVAGIDTTTVQGRIQKAAAFQMAVHEAAAQAKAGR